MLEPLSPENSSQYGALDSPRFAESNNEAYKRLKVEFEAVEKRLESLKEEISHNKSKYFTGIAFISFTKMAHKEKVTREAQFSAIRWFFNGCKYKVQFRSDRIEERPLIRIDPAPEPDEILWENLKYDFKKQTKMKMVTIAAVAIILMLSFCMIFGLKYLAYTIKKQYKGDLITVTNPDGTSYQKYRELSTEEDAQLQFISIVIFACAKVVNKIIDAVVAKLAVFERMYTKSILYTSAIQKIVLSQFLNTSVLIVIVHYFLKGDERYVFWGSGSLLVDIWYLMVFYSIVLPCFYIFNIPIFWNALKKCRLKRSQNTSRYTQQQANKIYEGVPCNPVRSYSDIYQIILTSLFFAPVFPMGVGILMGSLCIVYWVEKFYLLRLHSKPIALQADICLNTLSWIKVAGFTLTVGELYVDLLLRGTSDLSKLLITQTVVSFAFIWIPIEDIFLEFYTYTGEEAELKCNLDYRDCKRVLDTDYSRSNPFTKNSALMNHIQIIKRVQLLKKRSASNILKDSFKIKLKEESVPKINILTPEGLKQEHNKFQLKGPKDDDWQLTAKNKIEQVDNLTLKSKEEARKALTNIDKKEQEQSNKKLFESKKNPNTQEEDSIAKVKMSPKTKLGPKKVKVKVKVSS